MNSEFSKVINGMENPAWLTTMREYNGQPMAIRLRPIPATESARETCGHLLVITQEMAHVRADGMPEPDYNDSLFQFDGELIRELECNGLVVLVETYAGKRIYYAYVIDEVSSKERAISVLTTFGHLSEASFRGGADPDWKFYTRYMAENY
jgi:4-hydroxyphenylpyruvate dioxygenase-like putative hemolysin